MPGQRSLEVEISYSLDSSPFFRRLLELLWATGCYLVVEGSCMSLDRARYSRSLHFYGAETTDYVKRRLKLELDEKNISGELQEKIWSPKAKTEKRLAKSGNTRQTRRLLQRFGPISGSFYKERLSLIYVFQNELKRNRVRRLKIGIDRLVPFSIAQPTNKGACRYHVEFEGDGSGSEIFFVTSDYFKKHLSSHLTILNKQNSKWHLSRQLNRSPLTLAFTNEDEFVEFVGSVVDGVGEGPLEEGYFGNHSCAILVR